MSPTTPLDVEKFMQEYMKLCEQCGEEVENREERAAHVCVLNTCPECGYDLPTFLDGLCLSCWETRESAKDRESDEKAALGY